MYDNHRVKTIAVGVDTDWSYRFRCMLEQILKKVYEQEYGEVIGIKISEQDRNACKETQVDCSRLKYFISYSIHDKFYEETPKIFHRLDAQPKPQ
jgi:hypothetical protein